MFDYHNKFIIPDHTKSINTLIKYDGFDLKYLDGRFKNQISQVNTDGHYFDLPNFWSCSKNGGFIHVSSITYNHNARSVAGKPEYSNRNTHYTQDAVLGTQLRFSK